MDLSLGRADGAALAVDTVVFDLGGVLIDWNPRYLFRQIFGDDEAGMEAFLADVCNMEWNEQQDRGRGWSDAVADAVARHPAHASSIRAYRERWDEMLNGAIEETVTVLAELKAGGIRLLALTNWSAETFHIAEERFTFLQWFEGILVSGREGLMKPEPAIFGLLVSRYGVDPARAVFIDDLQRNVDASIAAGLGAVRFTGAAQLRRDLVALGLPVSLVSPVAG